MPEGSTLTMSASEDDIALSSMDIASMLRSIRSYIGNKAKYRENHRQAFLDFFAMETTYCPATLTLATRQAGEVRKYVSRQPDNPLFHDLPRHLRNNVDDFCTFRRTFVPGEEANMEQRLQYEIFDKNPIKFRRRCYYYNIDALLLAADSNKHEKVARYLEYGYNPNIGKVVTPLYNAAHSGHQKVVRLLYENGADQSFTDPVGKNARQVALAEKRHDCWIELKKPAPQEFAGFTSLHFAARAGNKELIADLFALSTKDTKPEVNANDNNGNSPAMIAAMGGHIDALEELRRNGATFTEAQKAKVRKDKPEIAATLDKYEEFEKAAKAIIEAAAKSIGPISDEAKKRLGKIENEVRASLIKAYGIDNAAEMQTCLGIATLSPVQMVESNAIKTLAEEIKQRLDIRPTKYHSLPWRRGVLSFNEPPADKKAEITDIFTSKDKIRYRVQDIAVEDIVAELNARAGVVRTTEPSSPATWADRTRRPATPSISIDYRDI